MGGTKPWTAIEWWDANVDKEGLTKALKAHKIQVLKWDCRRPVCPAKTDYGKVTEIAQGLIKKKRG